MVRALRLRMRILVLHYITPALVSDECENRIYEL